MKYKYGSLTTYICRDDYEEVLDILAKDKSFDVMHEEGKFFNLAVESNSHNIIKALLEYFEENQLKLCKDEYTRLSLKQKMLDIIEIAIEDNELSPEMQSILNPYLRVDEEHEEYIEDTSTEDNTFNFTEESSNNDTSETKEFHDTSSSLENTSLLGTELKVNFDNLSLNHQ